MCCHHEHYTNEHADTSIFVCLSDCVYLRYNPSRFSKTKTVLKMFTYTVKLASKSMTYSSSYFCQQYVCGQLHYPLKSTPRSRAPSFAFCQADNPKITSYLIYNSQIMGEIMPFQMHFGHFYSLFINDLLSMKDTK